MDEVEEKGFKALVNDKENHIKILIDIGLGVTPGLEVRTKV